MGSRKTKRECGWDKRSTRSLSSLGHSYVLRTEERERVRVPVNVVVVEPKSRGRRRGEDTMELDYGGWRDARGKERAPCAQEQTRPEAAVRCPRCVQVPKEVQRYRCSVVKPGDVPAPRRPQEPEEPPLHLPRKRSSSSSLSISSVKRRVFHLGQRVVGLEKENQRDREERMRDRIQVHGIEKRVVALDADVRDLKTFKRRGPWTGEGKGKLVLDPKGMRGAVKGERR